MILTAFVWHPNVVLNGLGREVSFSGEFARAPQSGTQEPPCRSLRDLCGICAQLQAPQNSALWHWLVWSNVGVWREIVGYHYVGYMDLKSKNRDVLM